MIHKKFLRVYCDFRWKFSVLELKLTGRPNGPNSVVQEDWPIHIYDSDEEKRYKSTVWERFWRKNSERTMIEVFQKKPQREKVLKSLKGIFDIVVSS